MVLPSDHDLLRRYARDDDHAAFAELVRRYIGLVYAAARRQTRGDPHLADDVTQAVMIVLARRADAIAPGSVLASWLLVVTRHCAQNALKIQSRQRIHEQRAAIMRADEQRAYSDSYLEADDDLHDALHGALARLREQDRAGLVLHYFQNHTHQQVGEALGLTAGAARKRVERAVEKVRMLLAGRGMVATSASIVAAMLGLSSMSSAVPAHLASSAVNLAMLASAVDTAPGSASLAIAHGVSRMFTIAKLKAAAAVLLIGAVGVPLAGIGAWTLATVGSPDQVAASSTEEPPATAPADANAKFTARVTDRISVTFLGVAPHPANETDWRDITGQPIEMPDPHLADNSVNTDSAPDQQMAIVVTAPPDTRFGMIIENSRTNSNSTTDLGGGRTLMRARFGMLDASETVSMRLAFATEPWKTVAECELGDQPVEADGGKYGPIRFMPPVDDARWGKGCVAVEHDPLPTSTGRLIAIDDQGNRHEQKLVNGDNNDDRWTTTFVFEVPAEKLKKVILQARDFDKYVIARDISISPDVTSEPKIEVQDAPKK